MKVLIATPHFMPLFVGGVETHTRRVADWLLAHGHQPVVATIDAVTGPESASSDDVFGYPVHRLRCDFARAGATLALAHDLPPIRTWMDAIVADTRPDVLHLQSGYLMGGAALAVARQSRIPSVVMLHDFWFICPRITLQHHGGHLCSGPDSAAKCSWCLRRGSRRIRAIDRLSRGAIGRLATRGLDAPLLARLLDPSSIAIDVADRQQSLLEALGRADAVLALSRFVKDQIVAAGVEASRVELYETGRTASSGADHAPRPASNRLNVGYLGQIAPHKGIHVLIDALRYLHERPVSVHVHGDLERDADYATKLKRSLGELRPEHEVHFHGRYGPDELGSILASLDIVAVPSVWNENRPQVILEALEAGVPVLASRIGGIPELVSDEGNGLQCRPDDAEDLARQLRRVLDDPSLLQRLRAGIRPVRTLDDEMRHLLGIYERVGARHSG